MKRLFLFILSYLTWTILTWGGGREEFIAGAIVSALVVFLFGDIYSVDYRRLFGIRRLLYLLYFVPLFVYECIKANIDVAWRVLDPRLPIKPGIVRVKTSLKRDVSLTMLANCITLTPGTMTMDVKDGYMYIHWINVRAKDAKKATEIISKKFEEVIGEVFE